MNAAHLGGISGYGISSASVTNCAVMSAKISGGTSNKRIAGSGTKQNNAAYSGLSASNDADIAVGAEDFYTQALYENTLQWNFTSIWLMNAEDYPTLAVYRRGE